MRKNRLEKGCTVYEINWLFFSLSRNVCFSCAQNCVSLGAKRKMKNKKRERKAESGLVITHTQKKQSRCCHIPKKKKARSTFKQKRDTNELALKKQFFFVFRKKVTNQLRLQFTFVFIVVTVLLLMMLYFSSSFLFKSLPTSALMLTARCTLIKRLTKKKKKRECARHSRNKNGGKKTKTHTTPAFLLCFFLASRSHSPSLPLTRTHMHETPHTLLDFSLSFFFFLRA